MIRQQQKIADIRKFLEEVYNKTEGRNEDLKSFSDEEILDMANNLRKGVPMATPVFDGAAEKEIKELFK